MKASWPPTVEDTARDQSHQQFKNQRHRLHPDRHSTGPPTGTEAAARRPKPEHNKALPASCRPAKPKNDDVRTAREESKLPKVILERFLSINEIVSLKEVVCKQN